MFAPTLEELMKLGLALLIGGLVGAEREYRDKAAGFRTMTLICVGAAIFTSASLQMGGPTMRDPARIAAQIVTGVGFLGAGVIVREGGRVTGITTAATIWLTAALGMGIGGGFYGLTLSAAVVVLLTLWLLPYVERRIDAIGDVRCYRVIGRDETSHEAVAALLTSAGLRLREHRRMRDGATRVFTWVAEGAPVAHERAADALLGSSLVTSFSY